MIFKLETRQGAFGARHHIAHVEGRGWHVLSDRGARGWHSAYATYQDAREHFETITAPIGAVDA